jgi:hypothetical protein
MIAGARLVGKGSLPAGPRWLPTGVVFVTMPLPAGSARGQDHLGNCGFS